jgi:hypothetical protein
MTEGKVASMRGDWAALVEAVNAAFSGQDFILLAEAESAAADDKNATSLLHFHRTKSLDKQTVLPRGRAFNAEREVRWRALEGGRFMVTHLAESADIPPSEHTFATHDGRWETIRSSQKLYGQWSTRTEDWVEVAVPGVSRRYGELMRSSPPPTSLRLEVVDYLLEGCVRMTRFCDLVADDGN